MLHYTFALLVLLPLLSELPMPVPPRRLLPACFLLTMLVTSSGCSPGGGAVRPKPASQSASDPFLSPCLVDVATDLGVRFVHDPGEIGSYDMPQIMGSGACLFDFDGDDDLDILLLSGVSRSAGGKSTGSRLFRQEADGKYVDVTATSGIVDEGYAMGAAAGDIDNDGDLDLYLTRYGEDRLYQNSGAGTFVDITAESGIANPQWATAASFLDYDRDGWLDLIVVNYVDFFPGSICEDGAGRRDYCGPESLSGAVDKLYRNLGGTAKSAGEYAAPRFEDVTVSSGLARRTGKGLGVLCRDFDGDGRVDIFVANDGEENFLWVQHDHGVFSNEAILRGVALNRFGEAEANMGVVADDFDNDALSDLFITHLREESSTLYRGAQFGQYTDQTVVAGFSVLSLPYTGFGVASHDFDHDGDVDLAIANGGVKRGATSDSPDVDRFWRDYAQRNEFYLNDGRGHFEAHTRLGGSDFAQRVEVSRALASGDIDNDGDVDLLLSNCAGPARLYRNEFPKQGAWLKVTAVDPELRRAAIGAQIQVRVGDKGYIRELNPSTGYLSCNDMRVHFGLGNATRYDSILVFWPHDGLEVEVFPGGLVNQPVKLERGRGKLVRSDSK